MDYIRLGRTDVLVSRIAIGAEALSADEAAQQAVRKAYSGGVNLFDVARKAGEEALGAVLAAEKNTATSIRRNIVIAAKTAGQTAEEVRSDVQASLAAMGVEKVNLLQYEAMKFLPMKDGADGIYAALEAMRDLGMVDHIGVVTEDYQIAGTAVRSGLYETLQYPYNVISPMTTSTVRSLCEREDVGFLAMRPLCGGVVQNLPLAYGFLNQYDNVVPLWGARSVDEVDELLYLYDHPPVIDETFRRNVEKLRAFFN